MGSTGKAYTGGVQDHEPDAYSLLMVQQYLSENGYTKALRALESESSTKFDAVKLLEGSCLMRLTWKLYEEELAKLMAETTLEELQQDEEMMRGTCDDYDLTLERSIEPEFAANLIDMKQSQSGEIYLAAGNSQVHALNLDTGNIVFSTAVGRSAALSVDLHPQFDTISPYIAASSMDGSVTILNRTGQLIVSKAVNHRLISKVAWLEGGEKNLLLALCGDTVRCLAFSHVPGEDPELTEIQSVPFKTSVTDVCLLDRGERLVVATRDSNCLRVMKVDVSAQQPLQAMDTELVNLNINKDDHVSFYAMRLVASPDGQFLLVCTEAARMIVLRTQGLQQMQSLYGLPIETFHVPCACWHPRGLYVYVASAHGVICVFHVGSGQLVTQLKGHKANVRSMLFDTSSKNLLSCGFDKKICVFRDKRDAAAVQPH